MMNQSQASDGANLLEVFYPQNPPFADRSAEDVFAAISQSSSQDLPDCCVTYKSLVAGSDPGQGALNAHHSRLALYRLLSEPSTQHLAFALGILLRHNLGVVALRNGEFLETYGRPDISGMTSTWSLRGVPFHIILLKDELVQGDLAATLAHECVHTLLWHMCGSADPAHLATQRRLLTGLDPNELEAFDLAIRADQGTTEHISEWEKSQLRGRRMIVLRAFMFQHASPMVELERQAPNFAQFYMRHLKDYSDELDYIVAKDLTNLNQRAQMLQMESAADLIEDAVQSGPYHPQGYDNEDPSARQTVREEVVARLMQAYIHFKTDQVDSLLPGVSRWYSQHIRAVFENFARCSGLPDPESESGTTATTKYKPEPEK